MGLRQDDRADRRRLNRKLLPVKLAQVLEPLEQPAIDQQTVAAMLEQKAGSGDRSRRTVEGEVHGGEGSLRRSEQP